MPASWPPIIGERLPSADKAFGIVEKLTAYCLNLDHEIGAHKARMFQRLLGIDAADVAYLADVLQRGVRNAPITDIRDNTPFGLLCEVRIPVAGLRDRQDRAFDIVTSWELRHAKDAPRLVTAYIDG
jgi:filamentous hemagglutinin